MAQQLRQKGQEVALLVLIAPTPPTREITPSQESPTRSKSSNLFIAGSVDRILPGPHQILAAITRWLKQRGIVVTNVVNRMRCNVYLITGRQLPYALRTFYTREVMYGNIYPAAAKKYVPQVYPGRIILLQPENHPANTASWRQLDGDGLEIRELGGGHKDMLSEPLVAIVARHLKIYLDEAQALLKLDRSGETVASPQVVG